MTDLRTYIQQFIVLQPREWQFVQERFERVELHPQQLLLKEGSVCRYLYFLEEGLLRYFIWNDGIDKTKFFTYHNIFFTSIRSFRRGLPATENIQALEYCRLQRVHIDRLKEIQTAIPRWQSLTTAVVSQVQVWTEDLMLALQNETAADRYRKMLVQQPDLVRRIPLKYLASFLGIAPESLSRIRRQMA